MELRETLYYAKRLLIGSALGRVQTISRPMNYSSNFELAMKCKMFSEGNDLLENALYYLNQSGINTFACCKGHRDKGGYIAFLVNDENRELVSKMCGYILDNTSASVSIDPHHYNAEGISASIYFSTEERKKILDIILERSLYENIPSHKIIDEMIDLSDIQNKVHQDMTFGLLLKKENDTYNVETSPIFLMYSLERYVSIPCLEAIHIYLSDLGDELDGKSISPIHLLNSLKRVNKNICEVVSVDDNALSDYYPNFTEDELVKIMEMNLIIPGKLEQIMKNLTHSRMTEEDDDYYWMITDSPAMYFLVLKFEESLEYKRQNLSLQEEKRVL